MTSEHVSATQETRKIPSESVDPSLTCSIPLTVAVVRRGEAVHSKSFTMKSWDTLTELSKRIKETFNIKNQRLFYAGKVLEHNGPRIFTLSQCFISRGATIYVQNLDENNIVEFFGLTSTAKSCTNLLKDVVAGFQHDFTPKLSEEGTGATYFLSNQIGEIVGCFKPRCEEQNATHNPRGTVGVMGNYAMERPIRSGEMSLRETAAYILDHTGFHGVPKTTHVEIRKQKLLSFFNYNRSDEVEDKIYTGMGSRKSRKKVKLAPKIGSLQEFIRADEEFANNDPRCYSAREVHKIGILDVRLLNCDRNSDNMLTIRDPETMRLRLVPIDHGLSFPDKLELGWCDWEWASWPQAKENFDPYARNFIKSIDVEADIERLSKELPLSPAALDNIRISGMLLQVGAKHGLTLYEIAKITLRQDLQKPSELEQLRAQAETLTGIALLDRPGNEHKENPNESADEKSGGLLPPNTDFFQGFQLFRRESEEPAVHMLRVRSLVDCSMEDPLAKLYSAEDTNQQGLLAHVPEIKGVNYDLDCLNLSESAISAHTTNMRITTSQSPKSPPDHRESEFRRPTSNSSSSSLSTPNPSDSKLHEELFAEKSRAYKSMFFYYVKKLIEMKCMNIRQSKVSDEKDVYDMDTPHGTFNGLRGLTSSKYRIPKSRKADYSVLYDKMLSEPAGEDQHEYFSEDNVEVLDDTEEAEDNTFDYGFQI